MSDSKKLMSHFDVINELYAEIESVFASVGGIAPCPADLFDSQTWRYCKPVNPKDKGKIGYICSFLESGNSRYPRVKIVVHSFGQGGVSNVFDSYRFTKDMFDPKTLNVPRRAKTDPAKAEKQRLAALVEQKRKQQLFDKHLQYWEAGSPYTGCHGYVKTKSLTDNPDLRLINGNRLAYPLSDVHGNITAVQTISAKGDKRIYGKKKGSFYALGDLTAATRIYICEGYATGDAIHYLVEKNQQRKVPFCVIVAVDAKNLECVAARLKAACKQKIITICPDNDWKKPENGKHNVGLLSGYTAALATYSDIKVLPATLCDGSDWHDALQHFELAAIEAFAVTEEKQRFAYACARLGCFPHGTSSLSLEKAVYRALLVGNSYYPARLSEDDILKPVLSALANTTLGADKVMALWRKIKRRAFANALRTKSIDKAQLERFERITVSSMQDAHTACQELKAKHPKAVFITNAPMGMGKTKDFMQPEFMADDMQGRVPVVITPTRSLTKGVSERFYASHYIDDVSSPAVNTLKRVNKDGSINIPSALAITVNSIISPKFKDVLSVAQTVYVDEYTQVLRAISSGTVEAPCKRDTEQRLAWLIQQSQYTYIADADFNQIALNQLYDVLDDERPVFLFQMERCSDDQAPVEYQFYQHKDAQFVPKFLMNEIKTAALEGETLYVASDAKTQLDTLNTALVAENISVLHLTADNANLAAQRAFLDNPNQYLVSKRPQVVLVSPCVQSGVSIEVAYFSRCFGLYAGVVAPAVFQQMLHRVRTQRIFELALPNRVGLSNALDCENATALLLGVYTQYIEQRGGVLSVAFDAKSQQHTLGALRITNVEGRLTIEGDTDYARFERLTAELQALDNQQTRHAANFLLLQALARGVTVTPKAVTLNELGRQRIKYEVERDKETTEAQGFQRILLANIIDEDTARKLRHKTGSITESEQLSLVRFTLVKSLGVKPEALTLDDIDFHARHGVKYVANYQALLQGVDKARQHDIDDAQKGVAKMHAKWREQKVRLLTVVFEGLGLNQSTGQGSYTQVESQRVRAVIKDDPALVRYVSFKLHLNVDNQLSDTAFMNKLIKKLLGLTLDRTMERDGERRVWRYRLKLKSVLRLQHYHQKRFVPLRADMLSPENLISNTLPCDDKGLINELSRCKQRGYPEAKTMLTQQAAGN